MDIRLDSLDTVPSCSLSILMVGIMLIFPWYKTRSVDTVLYSIPLVLCLYFRGDSIVLIQCPRVA